MWAKYFAREGIGRMSRPAFLVLSEDGSEHAVPTLVAILKSIFALLVPPLRLSLDDKGRVRFEPPEDRLRAALSGNTWKAKKGNQQSRIDLVRTIASQLKRGDAFVVFHIDGDVTYAERDGSTNVAEFKNKIVDPVFQLLRGDANAAVLLSKLILMTPCYCLEGWTYYNHAVLETVANPEDEAQIIAWKSDPGSVEECVRPWSRISVGKKHNRELATDFPAVTPLISGKSFADVLINMLFNEMLLNALHAVAQQYPPPPWRSDLLL
jgi:hypothetical protein